MFKQINIISNKFISTSTLNAIINFNHKIQHKSLRHVKLNKNEYKIRTIYIKLV